MTPNKLRCRTRHVAAAGMITLAAATATRAAITQITANLDAAVTESVDGSPASNDNSLESFPETSPTLPIEALAGLGDFDGSFDLDYGARAVASFSDPTLPDDPNPAELGVEAVAFSRDESIAYDSQAHTAETRTVEFTADDLGVASNGLENLVLSTAFIDGAALLWTNDANRDLSGMSVQFRFEIVQDDDGAELVVFEAELTVDGEPNGEVHLVHSSILDVTLGGPELLETDADAATLEAVQALDAVGRVHVILVPTQAVEYAYFATAGRAFTLRADARCSAVNLAGGTGSAVVFGRSFATLAPALEPFIDQSKAQLVQAALNRQVRGIADDGVGRPLGAVCGSLGLEAPLLVAAGLCGMRRRRRVESTTAGCGSSL